MSVGCIPRYCDIRQHTPACIADDRDAGLTSNQAAWRSLRRRSAVGRRNRERPLIDEERVLDAGERLDLIEVRAHRLAAERRTFHETRIEHPGQRDVDAV